MAWSFEDCQKHVKQDTPTPPKHDFTSSPMNDEIKGLEIKNCTTCGLRAEVGIQNMEI